MKSNELLRDVFEKKSFKVVAAESGFPESYLYKCCEPDGGKSKGALNPLERLAILYRVTQDLRLLHWVCASANGHFAPNLPGGRPLPPETAALLCRILQEMAALQLQLAPLLTREPFLPSKSSGLEQSWWGLQSDMAGYLSRCRC